MRTSVLSRFIAPVGLALALTGTQALANKDAAPAAKPQTPQAAKTYKDKAQDAKARPAAAVTPVATGASAAAVRGRDWRQIDTNGDNLISPEEMEAWLAANPGPLRQP